MALLSKKNSCRLRIPSSELWQEDALIEVPRCLQGIEHQIKHRHKCYQQIFGRIKLHLVVQLWEGLGKEWLVYPKKYWALFWQLKQKLTYELLTTFLAKVTAIIKARALVAVSTDSGKRCILTPTTLLALKAGIPFMHKHEFGTKEILSSQCKFVQHLAETFWNNWKKEYIALFQACTK